MSGLLALLPVIAIETTDRCIESILMEDSAAGLARDELLLVDNSREGWAAERYGLRTYRDPDGHNLGVARSWNIGAREVMEQGLDYLVIVSASMQFGPALHTTWRRQMNTFWGSHLIESEGHSWHLLAIHRTVFERIGLMDTNFAPGYWEADDFVTRMLLARFPIGWPRAWVNALSQGSGLAIGKNGQVSCPAAPLLAYYQRKWNGPKGKEGWDLPFGDKPLDYFEDVPIPELAKRYGWEVWW